MKKKYSSMGRAPPRSKKSQLFAKGYHQYEPGGGSMGVYHTRSEAQKIVDNMHEKGMKAQVVSLGPTPMTADYGPGYVVMYQPKIGRKS